MREEGRVKGKKSSSSAQGLSRFMNAEGSDYIKKKVCQEFKKKDLATSGIFLR